MDKTTKELFGRFPREVGLSRQLVYNIKQFENYISVNNSVIDVYTSVYPSNYLIDKIFFDFDYGPCVLDDAKKMYKWMKDKDYDAVPIVSGTKKLGKLPRYHLYMITQPKIYGPQTKLFLTKATYSIIKSVFGSFRQELFIDSKGKQSQVLRNADRIIGPDPMICGDIRRLCRSPNTLRPPENLNYCTYLPPDEFLDMSESDVISHMKKQHTYEYDIRFNKAPLLKDFEYDFDDVEFKEWKSSKKVITNISSPNLFLEQILRPCLYRNIISMHPSHMCRVACTVDLLKAGYSTKEILGIYSVLGWEDFERGICLQQIESCKKYESYSCSKLRKSGVPEICCVG